MLVLAAIATLILIAPKDCLLGQRIPGPDSFRCSTIAGLEWTSRTTAYLVMGGIALAAVLAYAFLSRRPKDRASR